MVTRDADENEDKVCHQRIRLAFDHETLKVFKDGVCLLCDICSQLILTNDSTSATQSAGIQLQLKTLMREKWNKIRDLFILEPSLGVNLSEGDADPAKLMFGLYLETEKLRESIDTSTSCGGIAEMDFNRTIDKLKNDLAKVTDQLKDMHWNTNKTKTENVSLTATVQHLKTRVQEKTDEIAQLRKDSTVQLWEKEKRKLLEQADIREKDYESIIELQKNEKTKLHEKLKELREQHTKNKLKNEMHCKQPLSSGGLLIYNNNNTQLDFLNDVSYELEKTKQHLFIMEQDIRKLDCEMFKQQKYVVGMFTGLSEDLSRITDSLPDKDPSEIEDMVAIKKEVRRLTFAALRMSRAAREGKLGMLRADLPDNYITISEHFTSPVKKLSTAYNVQRNSAVNNLFNEAESIEKLNNNETDEGNLKIKEIRSRLSKLKENKIENNHPLFVNPRNGFIDMIKVLKYFPHMTQPYVKEQWRSFKKYDTNNDETLDLPEMMLAMTSTVGQEFSANQIQEALAEADIDGSNTIDFYEYLSVADMLAESKGRAEVFQSKFVKQQGRNVSKTCIVM